MKANHNHRYYADRLTQVVYQVKDTIFWKQITTVPIRYAFRFCCLSSQRYNFLKANHNWNRSVLLSFYVVYQVKDTIFWKQITTRYTVLVSFPVLFIKSKIQFFESKSQLSCLQGHVAQRCLSSQRYNFLKANHNAIHCACIFSSVVYQVKDTIFWKQITTLFVLHLHEWWLFIKSKIQFFELKIGVAKANHNNIRVICT